MADSEKVPEQQQLKHQKQQLNHLDGINGDGGQIQLPADDEPQTPKQIIGKCPAPQRKKSWAILCKRKWRVATANFIIQLNRISNESATQCKCVSKWVKTIYLPWKLLSLVIVLWNHNWEVPIVFCGSMRTRIIVSTPNYPAAHLIAFMFERLLRQMHK